jgi:molybdopterin/thiamine biosynthesis adenylyltransferase
MPNAPSLTSDIDSRSLLAGYDPAVLHNASVLVVGLGALGQNIVQTLSLSGIGRMILVDFDTFEPHNATRSPFFPHETGAAGVAKAPSVARRCRQVATAPEPRIHYANTLVQRLGDAAISWCDVAVSAVDSVGTRAWLAERSRLHGKPMAEGGFSGSVVNFSLFSGADNRACYRCHNPHRESSASCTRYALRAESQNIVPAIQSGASVLAGLMSEQVIQALHGQLPADDERYYGDVRRPFVRRSRLRPNPRCPGVHTAARTHGVVELTDRLTTVADLAGALLDIGGSGSIVLSEPLHLRYPCVGCGRMCSVRSGESSWLADSRCEGCGGPWPLSGGRHPASVTTISVPGDLTGASPLMDLPVAELGVRPGGGLVYDSDDAGRGLISFAGSAESSVSLVTSW